MPVGGRRAPVPQTGRPRPAPAGPRGPVSHAARALGSVRSSAADSRFRLRSRTSPASPDFLELFSYLLELYVIYF